MKEDRNPVFTGKIFPFLFFFIVLLFFVFVLFFLFFFFSSSFCVYWILGCISHFEMDLHLISFLFCFVFVLMLSHFRFQSYVLL